MNVVRFLNIPIIISRKTLIIVVALVFAGCATPTKPNIPYSGSIPQLDKIAQRYPLLTTELRKLPEIQDGVSQSEVSALEKIVELYDRFPDKFDETFEQMYKVGLPNVRKYCSPLQAILWLAEDWKDEALISVLHDYSLENLIKNAVVISDKSYNSKGLNLSEEQIREIISGLSEEEQNSLGRFNLETKKDALLFRYTDNPAYFSEKSKEIIKESLRVDLNYLRWKDFDTVVDRLNDPELIQYWINGNLTYVHEPINYGQSPKQTFERRTGDCEDFAIFSVYCYNRCGYNSLVVTNVWAYHPGNNEGHSIGALKEENRYYIIGDSNFENIIGPFKSYLDIGRSIHPNGDIFIQNWSEALQANR